MPGRRQGGAFSGRGQRPKRCKDPKAGERTVQKLARMSAGIALARVSYRLDVLLPDLARWGWIAPEDPKIYAAAPLRVRQALVGQVLTQLLASLSATGRPQRPAEQRMPVLAKLIEGLPPPPE